LQKLSTSSTSCEQNSAVDGKHPYAFTINEQAGAEMHPTSSRGTVCGKMRLVPAALWLLTAWLLAGAFSRAEDKKNPSDLKTGTEVTYPARIKVTLTPAALAPFTWSSEMGNVFRRGGFKSPFWLLVREDRSLRSRTYASGSKYVLAACDMRPGTYVAVCQSTYKVIKSEGEGGSALERYPEIDLERVDAIPDGGQASFSDPVFSIPMADPKVSAYGDPVTYDSQLYDRSLKLYTSKGQDPESFADLKIGKEIQLGPRSFDTTYRWVTVSKDSVFNLRDDKEMKAWLKVVDFVPRNDELGITGWIRVMRVDEPATPPKPAPSKQQPPAAAQPRNPQPAKP
jgi:hypothetical protein